jgi:hypothetical protein
MAKSKNAQKAAAEEVVVEEEVVTTAEEKTAEEKVTDEEAAKDEGVTTAEEKTTTAKVTYFKKGDRVKVNEGAKTYTGSGFAAFVYQTVYEVLEVGANGKPDCVVIGFIRGNAVVSAINAKDLTKVG